MPWVVLALAGLFEIAWAYSMKLSQGFTKPAATAVTVVTMIISFALLAHSMRCLPLGTAYVIWTGIGALGAFVLGIFLLGEAVSVMRIGAACLIVSGLILMKIATPG